MSVNIFVDTNIFVYAHVSGTEAKHRLALDFLKSQWVDDNIIISTQVLSEFYAAMVKCKREHGEIVRFMKEIIRDSNVIDVSLATIEYCLTLKEKYGYSYWDSLILAAAVKSNCSIVYSEDMQDNQFIEGVLTIKNPFVNS